MTVLSLISNPKDALGRMKVNIGLFPNIARIWGAMVFAQSAPDYGEFNYRGNAVSVSEYINAIERHAVQFRAGQDLDGKSKLPHVAHIIASAAIILEAAANGVLIDDRYEGDKSAELLDALTPTAYDKARAKTKPRPARTLDQVNAELLKQKAAMARIRAKRAGKRGRRRKRA